MLTRRTDLALEAQELWKESAEKTTRLPGVRARTRRREGWPITRVEILNDTGAKALGKPVGTYVTVDLTAFRDRREDFFGRAVRALGAELRELLPQEGTALVVGLGNRAMTPDAVGPQTLDHLLVTRHLLRAMPQQFSGLRPVAAVRTGVLATTGLESAELVRGAAETVRPDFIVAVDALAARRMARVCATVQISDTGIAPGSGVGNRRMALNQDSLGVPVFAVGIPTVVDGATLAADLMEEAGVPELDPEALRGRGQPLMVTPQDIDARVRDLSKVVGYALNWALQGLDVDEIDALLS